MAKTNENQAMKIIGKNKYRQKWQKTIARRGKHGSKARMK
jgi:hypothetical protein